MKIILHRNFEKRYKKLRPSEKEKFKERRDLFLKNPFDPILRNHPLGGPYKGFQSLDITGDLRVIYKQQDADTAIFLFIDTHSNLYK